MKGASVCVVALPALSVATTEMLCAPVARLFNVTLNVPLLAAPTCVDPSNTATEAMASPGTLSALAVPETTSVVCVVTPDKVCEAERLGFCVATSTSASAVRLTSPAVSVTTSV